MPSIAVMDLKLNYSIILPIVVSLLILFNRISVLLSQSLSLGFELGLLLLDVCGRREIDMHCDSELLASCVLVMERMRAIQNSRTRSNGSKHVKSFRRVHFTSSLVFIHGSHKNSISCVSCSLLRSVAEKVTQEVSVLLEREAAHNRIVRGLGDSCLMVSDPIHILRHLDLNRIIESHLIIR